MEEYGAMLQVNMTPPNDNDTLFDDYDDYEETEELIPVNSTNGTNLTSTN